MSLVRDIEILRRVPLLAQFTEDQLRLLAFSAETLQVPKGGTVFNEGERADGGIVLTIGNVQLETGMGRVARPRGTYGPGTLFGENALMAEGKRPARAVALEDCELIRIRRALFSRMLQEFPETAQKLYVDRANQFTQATAALARVGRRLDEVEALSERHKKEVASKRS
ncbi:Cyclic nucleotide-binding domain protein [Pseudovibrio axinellae]|uniref:Cyclic nucleotide-binding domain protein n=1 Tax=Pseudovibrio axinellae TaxID=989403 RepID=A0A165Z9F1_9HYPH|nr:cyclic nucleotide-binding domain-containing protein [Pseudovibrio axinellae]KZL19629.1 Cyclic nucleotide-binding domain protein [Pseudovibrio axinellae]SEQ34801.1 Cyclic nucleotide-binding domain-containing protein [Pseudovibrio axinellae]